MAKAELKTCTGKKPFPFMRYKWFFIFISLIFVSLSARELYVNGLNLGVDFKGGTKILYQFSEPTSIDKIRRLTDSLGIGNVQVIRFGNDSSQTQYLVRAKYIANKDVSALLNNKIKEAFASQNVLVLSQEVVGPKVGHDLQKKGYMSVLLACLLILCYIGFRFDFLFSPGAIIALAHDILISIGFFAFFGKEFNLPILAALLTILGYSINDTIVIYDRIRENIGRLSRKTATVDVIDISITETLRRTIVTSLTVLFVVVTLFFIGGGVLHDFAFCLIVGTIFGTYSSVFIASPIYLALQKLFPTKGIKVTEAIMVKAS